MRRPIFATTLLVLMLGLAHAGGASAATSCAPPREFFGIDSQDVWEGNDAYQRDMLNRQQRLNIGMMRLVFDWNGIEREPNKYTFERYDRYIAATAQRGIEIMPMLFNPPQWRSGRPPGDNTRGVYPPARFTDMGDFGAVIARRYGAQGSFWRSHPEVPKLPIRYYQIWTEPNIPTSWPPRPDAAQYAGLLKATSPRIKAADPTARIVSAGLPQTGMDGTIPMRTYVAQMYQAGGAEGFDYLALNPYSETPAGSVALVESARQIMLQYGDGNAGTWVTEVGWASGGTPYRFTTDEAGQATRLRQLFTDLARRRLQLNLHGVVWFTWHDIPTPPEAWPFHTGLLRVDSSPKPAYNAYRDTAEALARCRASGGNGRSSLVGSGLPSDFVGISAPEVVRASQRSKARTFGQQGLIGVQSLRQVFDRRVVRRGGRYDLWLYDRLISAAAQSGIRVLPILEDSPRAHGKRRRARLAAFAKALVVRYGAHGTLWRDRPGLPRLSIRSWQVWQNPNLPSGWGGRPEARSYAGLLRAVSKTIKRRDRSAEVIAGSFSYKRGAVAPTRFITRLYRAHARRYFDGIAIAPSSRNTTRLLRRARAARRVMVRKGDRGGKLWITDMGWSDRGARSSLRVGTKGQARRVTRALRLLVRDRRRLALRGVAYVAWRDRRATGRSWVNNAGLLSRRGRPKPAYGAFGRGVRPFR